MTASPIGPAGGEPTVGTCGPPEIILDTTSASQWCSASSRNDVAANLAVFVAAGAVWLTASGWPDRVVAPGLAWLLRRSAARVMAVAAAELRSVD
jgi:Co/Zn/Cd efflux system component